MYHDGSTTDTVIEVNLKHPGKQNNQISYDHRWAVYVNPVGVDAAVASPTHRCVAAGFVWNPAFVQLTDPRNVRRFTSSPRFQTFETDFIFISFDLFSQLLRMNYTGVSVSRTFLIVVWWEIFPADLET